MGTQPCQPRGRSMLDRPQVSPFPTEESRPSTERVACCASQPHASPHRARRAVRQAAIQGDMLTVLWPGIKGGARDLRLDVGGDGGAYLPVDGARAGHWRGGCGKIAAMVQAMELVKERGSFAGVRGEVISRSAQHPRESEWETGTWKQWPYVARG